MKHILFVDDNLETRELVQNIFSVAPDIHIDFAANSDEAIDLFNTNSYNACILDVSLPDITGYYLGELIRKVCEDMPLAFLTNYEGALTKQNAEIINAHFWAKAKVFENPMQLIDMVRNICVDIDCSNMDMIEKPAILKQIT